MIKRNTMTKKRKQPKVRISVSIERDLIARLDEYVKNRFELTGCKVSKSSIVEQALSEDLIGLNIKLDELKGKTGDKHISIVK